ncbi:hypothetical protein DOT_0922 [Desulfosporosinus sp. OT]|nr:hypothetical protein DOT_0922 [Desulfosporosinus sp. OT]
MVYLWISHRHTNQLSRGLYFDQILENLKLNLLKTPYFPLFQAFFPLLSCDPRLVYYIMRIWITR